MFIDEIWPVFEECVFNVPSEAGLFNQYLDNDPRVDIAGGQLLRRENLKNYLNSFKVYPDIVLVGEAAGPWGCRFSGIPFTGENQLIGGDLPFSGRQTSNKQVPTVELTGSILWQTLLPHYQRFFLVNAVTFHPHNLTQPLSIRKPSKKEIVANSSILSRLLEAAKPETILAVGRVAEVALKIIGKKSYYIRHPSHGGAKLFKEEIKHFF